MKAKELQLGDYVDYRGRIIKVTSLYDKGGSNEVGWSDKESVWVNGRCIEPIPLTPEILEKNGWIKDGYFYKAEDGSYIQLGELFEHASFRAEKHGIPREIQTSPHLLKYIHQLQHALRLCGITGEIII